MWTGDDLYFMNMALDEAYKAEREGEVPIGAIIVSDGLLLGRGHNCPIGSNDPSAHAEIKALQSAGNWIKNYRMPHGTTMYVTLEPCLMCFGALIHARVDKVIYGAEDSKVGVTKHFELLHKARLNHQIDFVGGLMETECSSMLQEFFNRKRFSSGGGVR
ncbi:MAG: tRNA adenosine(34) deaminase TadA [Holophagaceae bacterium]|nr:tRNA adenosine(34) deaminase TadA [Holophagaceae bacterium]